MTSGRASRSRSRKISALISNFSVAASTMKSQSASLARSVTGSIRRRADAFVLIASEIQESQIWRGVQFRTVNLIAANHIHANAFRDQRHRETKRIRPILASRE